MITRNPTSNQHGYIQADLAYEFRKKLPKGKVIIKCSIKTQDGVKVADVAWPSDEFITQYGFDTPLLNCTRNMC